jgi:hypothetical protein
LLPGIPVLRRLDRWLRFAVAGAVEWTDGWLDVNLLFALVPMLLGLP